MVFLVTSVVATPAAALGQVLNARRPSRKATQGYEFVDFVNRLKMEDPEQPADPAPDQPADGAALDQMVSETQGPSISSREEYLRQLEEMLERVETERARQEWLRNHTYDKTHSYYKEEPAPESPDPATADPGQPAQDPQPAPASYRARDNQVNVTFASNVTLDQAIVIVSGFGATIAASTGANSYLVELPTSLPATQAIVAFQALDEVTGVQPVYESVPQPEPTPTPTPTPPASNHPASNNHPR